MSKVATFYASDSTLTDVQVQLQRVFLIRRHGLKIMEWLASGKDKIIIDNLVPRVLSYPSLRSERERPWLGLVTWSQNKINSEGGVLCLSSFLSGSFSPFTQ